MTSNQLAWMTAVEMSRSFDKKEISPLEVFEASTARLYEVNDTLNVFASLDLGRAREQAIASERRMLDNSRLSVLDGVPTSIKDLIAVRGLPLRFGSKVSSSELADCDAPVVERLRNSGAVILGKSTTSEFGCKAVGDSPYTGITRNPWNTSLTPGGSSCGAASMVAAGIVPYAIGTDGGGSLRIPASLSGLIGFKSQFARVPVYPASATPTLAHVGPLCRSTGDLRAVLGVICGYDRRDPFTFPEYEWNYNEEAFKPRKLKIAWSPTLGFARADEEVLRICEDAAWSFEALGHHVESVDWVMSDPIRLWTSEFYAGVGTRLRSVLEKTPQELDPAVLEVLREAITQDMRKYYETVFLRYEFREQVRRFFEKYDLLLTPTLPTTAFPVGLNVPPGYEDRSIVSWAFYTYPFNLTGQPAASVPAGLTHSGLPVGLQLVSGMHKDALLLSIVGQFENSAGHDISLRYSQI